mmetsp:Transcript_55208/g.103678  ORF Transcript_55208/g.103678 Transcript_55208/m.103678 type:complete len:217 (-) Transcript_55208:664-1314(-)
MLQKPCIPVRKTSSLSSEWIHLFMHCSPAAYHTSTLKTAPSLLDVQLLVLQIAVDQPEHTAKDSLLSLRKANPAYFARQCKPSRLKLTKSSPSFPQSSAFAAASSFGMICFLRDSTPASTTVSSPPTLTPHAFSTVAAAVFEDEMNVASLLRMSTTKKRQSSSSSFLASSCWALMSSAFLPNGAEGFVVSSTDTRSFFPPILKIFVSIMISSAGDK